MAPRAHMRGSTPRPAPDRTQRSLRVFCPVIVAGCSRNSDPGWLFVECCETRLRSHISQAVQPATACRQHAWAAIGARSAANVSLRVEACLAARAARAARSSPPIRHASPGIVKVSSLPPNHGLAVSDHAALYPGHLFPAADVSLGEAGGVRGGTP
jgi:hypothetical protein